MLEEGLVLRARVVDLGKLVNMVLMHVYNHPGVVFMAA